MNAASRGLKCVDSWVSLFNSARFFFHVSSFLTEERSTAGDCLPSFVHFLECVCGNPCRRGLSTTRRRRRGTRDRRSEESRGGEEASMRYNILQAQLHGYTTLGGRGGDKRRKRARRRRTKSPAQSKCIFHFTSVWAQAKSGELPPS